MKTKSIRVNFDHRRENRGSLITIIVMMASLAVTIQFGYIMTEQKVNAFPHAGIVIVPDDNDPNQENAKPISLFLGHSNEPTFGLSKGIHDGKHAVEVFLTDQATELPISGALLKVDKYYFKNYDNFAAATSPNDADDIKTNVPLPEAFGDKGHYLSRQIQQPGIYGYKLTGTINYYDVAQVPVSETVFCSIPGKDTSKFNSEGWFGGFGCTEPIQSIFFPSATTQAQVEPSGIGGSSNGDAFSLKSIKEQMSSQ
ncbi:MAG: hypothetical protein WB511_13670 [Nitrososphaeraceae archaeon]